MKKDPFLARQARSFHNAFDGIGYNFKTQMHFRIHIAAAIIVLVLAIYYSVSNIELIILTLLIGLIFAAETINTAIEETCNLLHPDIHPHARIAKHCAAASVLILSITAVLIGMVIFLPKIFN